MTILTFPSSQPFYYFRRGTEYLNWTGHLFTDDEACAWLGTADHVDAFRRHHDLARASGVSIIMAETIPTHSEEA